MRLFSQIAVFYALFMLAAMVWPTVRVWRTSGINPLVLPKGDSIEGFVGTWFKLLLLMLGLYLAFGAAGVIQPIGSIELPGKVVLRQIGMAILGLTFVWVVIVQWQMGNSWRVGIDSSNRTDLVVRGLFRVSRNPIFLGMMVQMLGLFLAMPDAVTLAVLIATYVLISVQIRLEEAHLLALQGESYRAYCAKVRRWLGLI